MISSYCISTCVDECADSLDMMSGASLLSWFHNIVIVIILDVHCTIYLNILVARLMQNIVYQRPPIDTMGTLNVLVEQV